MSFKRRRMGMERDRGWSLWERIETGNETESGSLTYARDLLPVLFSAQLLYYSSLINVISYALNAAKPKRSNRINERSNRREAESE